MDSYMRALMFAGSAVLLVGCGSSPDTDDKKQDIGKKTFRSSTMVLSVSKKIIMAYRIFYMMAILKAQEAINAGPSII